VGLSLAMLLWSVDVDELSAADRVRFLRAQERLNAAGSAATLRAIGSIADAYDGLVEDIEDPEAGASLEIRAALRWTRRAAETELGLAHDLRMRLPRLFQALAGGVVDRPRVRVLVRHTDHLSVAHARMVIDAVVGEAAGLTTGQLTEAVRRLCLDIDPAGARERYMSSRTGRRVVSYPDPDGTVTLSGIGLDPVEVAGATDLINRLARQRRCEDRSRSIDQHRADVYSDLVNGRISPDGSSPSVSRSGSVHLLVDLATLAGMREDSADLAGYGPIAADIARQVTDTLGEGVWDWTLTHPATGMPLTDGTTRRRPTASQHRKVRAKHRTCVAPGCRMPATDCDIDHTLPWTDTGITDSRQLAPLCRHDHCTRHQTGWTYTPTTDGDHHWTSPLGTHYTTSGRSP